MAAHFTAFGVGRVFE
ncbi:hypothetical protein RDG66_15820 [Vibrio cholerae]|nr:MULTISPECIES: hypothetical protein [Vibrio]